MSVDDLLRKQRKLAQEAAELPRLKDDAEALMKEAARLTEQIGELAKAAARIGAELVPSGGPEERVVLTPDQRKRIAEASGVAMDVLVVQDSDGSFAKAMPRARKHEIERLAAREASAIASRKAREEGIEKLIKTLEKIDAPGIDEIVASIRRDPSMKELEKQQKEAAERAKEAGAAAGPQPGTTGGG